MNRKGYIIEKYNNMGTAYTCRRLADEAKNLGMAVQIIGVCDTCACPDGLYNNGKKLKKADFAINRFKAGSIKKEVNAIAAKQYNEQNRFSQYVNKFEQVKNLASDGFYMPKYILSTLHPDYDFITSYLGTPFVIKGLASSQGDEVFLVGNGDDYIYYRNQYGADKEWLLEEFIGESYGKDIRFYSIRGEVIACMTRVAKQGFKANVALGADVYPYEVTEHIRQAAKDIYRQTGLDFLGIDLLYGKEKPYFCEINVMPGIAGMEKATGVNVARCVIETIKQDFLEWA